MLIEDAKSGHVAEVTYEGLLKVLGVSIPWEAHHSAEHGSVFAVGNPAVAMDGTENVVLHIENTSQTDLMFISTVIVGGNSTNAVKVRTYTGSAYTSGGTAATPRNFNLVSRNVAEATAYNGSDMVVSGGTMLCACYAPLGTFSIPLGGVLVLGYKDTIHWTMEGENAKDAVIGARFFYHGGRY